MLKFVYFRVLRGQNGTAYSESRELGVSKIVPVIAKEQWLSLMEVKILIKNKDGKLPMRPPNSNRAVIPT